MTRPILELRDLVKRFGGLTATDHVNLSLMPNEIHALIGPNGAGKSTLINQICGELKPDAGQIELDGHDVRHMSVAERTRAGIGRTFQVVSLIEETSVLANVSLAGQIHQHRTYRLFDGPASRREITRNAEALLSRSLLRDRMNVEVRNLSHGERKQLELVLAEAIRPKLLLLDEPMAGLGHAESVEMIQTLRRLRQDYGILLVEHDMDAVFALADRVSVLVYGRIIATGTVEHIRSHPEVLAAYLGEETE